MSFWFLVTAAFIAMGLGALHALEPGHGKTVVGAYLVGSRGSARHAVFLGLLVTGSHTAGVYLLGAITLYASRYIVPEQIYPWLAVVSGLMVAVLAIYLLLRAWTGESGNHSHAPGESHNQWLVVIRRRFSKPGRIDDFPQVLPAETTAVREQISLKQLLVLGITGGIVPCPAALVVLLSALSLHRTGFGLFLIVCFSFGLAAVLIVIGLLMVYSRKLVARWKGDSVWITRWLPLASAGFMLVLGVTIAGRALLTMGIHPSAIAHGRTGSLLAIVALGLFLGMRHSTDADHVVAVSTIVSRERSMSQGALIGMLWGFGHTLTIFLVGAAIILFRIVIPPRVGLSMEFAVAAMLILLGVLNLTGTLRRVTNRLTPPAGGVTAEVAAPQGCDAASSSRPWTKLTRKFGWYQLLRPLAIGLVHGLAGSAAVALLVLSMIPNPVWAICYLLVFGFGTVLGMMIMTWAISIPIAYTGNRLARTTGYLTTISGLVSVAFGIFLVYHIGFVDGLFTSHVHWTPE